MTPRNYKVNAHAVRLSYFLCDPLLSVAEAERMARQEGDDAQPASPNTTPAAAARRSQDEHRGPDSTTTSPR